MNTPKYGMEDCPLKMHETEFKHGEDDLASNMEITVALGKEGYKYGRESYIDIDADQGMAYPIGLAVKVNGEWHTVEEATALRVVIRGDYEQTGLLTSLQRIALMTLPIYGKMKTTEEQWDEDQNAIREQT